MGTEALSTKVSRQVGDKEMWRVEQALLMIATSDHAQAGRSAGCSRSELDKLGAALECAMTALERGARTYLPGAQQYPQHGVRTFGTPWGDERVAAKQIAPDTLSGMRLVFAGDQIAFGVNRHLAWTNLHFPRADILDLSGQLRREAKAQARHKLMAAARLKRKPWLSLGEAVRVSMIDTAKGRERHLAALCPTRDMPSKCPPAWLIYLLGIEAAERQQQRCLSLWEKAKSRLLDDLARGRVSARGEIGGVSFEIPSNEWTHQGRLNLLDNSLGVRENITVCLSQDYQSPPERDTFISSPKKVQKSATRGRPKEYKDDLKKNILEIGRIFKVRSDYLNNDNLSNSKIVEYIQHYCESNLIKCPGRTTLQEWVREIR